MKHFLLSWFLPAILLVLTFATTLIVGGSAAMDESQDGVSAFANGLSFSIAMITILSAHSLGHYIAAKKNNVSANPPYFVPAFNLYGTAGAFVKMEWPINDRNALLHIFLSGPIASFVVSAIVYCIGLSVSEVIEVTRSTEDSVVLGESITSSLATLLVHGNLGETKDVLLHPIAFAGWGGLLLNFTHLLPIGKLDGGRIVYALFGYNVARLVGYGSLFVILLLGIFLSNAWIGIAIWGLIATIKFRNQYSSDQYEQPITRATTFAVAIALIILVVSFIPVPILWVSEIQALASLR